MLFRKKRVLTAAETTLAVNNDASMGEVRNSHKENVLSELVGRLLSGADYEEDNIDEQSYEDALNLAKSIIDGHGSLHGSRDIVLMI